jgi:cobyrinic acid a,c-diamide synthase
MTIPALIIAGSHSGSGKTTITLAVMAALIRRGLKVQGFKVGPDFIDPGHHSTITGRASRNLDTWLLDPDALGATYRRGALGADLAVIEGVMGLFDGRGALDESGSTADLARRLGLPVVLVVDAKGMARSIAPLVRGFSEFDPEVQVVGVIANRVGSRRHHDSYLAPALAKGCPKVETIGFLPRVDGLAIPSRHLGLQTAEEFAPGSRFFDALADAAEASLDLDRLVALARVPGLPEARVEPPATPGRKARVALARDPAFCFYYEDNLDNLRDSGGEIVAFSPLDDRELPEGADVLYLGGGYPEVFADRLASNRAIRAAIRRFHAAGGTILAECGGLMVCCRELVDGLGRSWPMWDLIPARVAMQPRFAALGYVTVVAEGPTPLGPCGTTWRGHEFHYSTLEPLAPLVYATRLHGLDREPKPDGIRVGGLLAGYAHAHFGSNPEAARHLLGLRPFP